MAFDFNTFGQTPETAAKPTGGGFNFDTFGSGPAQPPAPKPVEKTNANKIASSIGSEKLLQGIGQTIANKTGVQDTLIAVHDQSLVLTKQLQDLIKTNKLQGKNTSRLQKTLNNQLKGNAELINQINEAGTGGLTNKEVIGSAIQTGANFIPGAGPEAGILARTAIGAATGYAYDVGQNLQENKSIKDSLKPGAGTVTGGLLPIVTKGLGTLAKASAGFTSGVGSDVIDRAIKNPNEVDVAVKKFASTPEAKQELVDSAKSSIQSYLQQRSSEYGESVNKLTSKVGFQGKQTAIDSFKNEISKFGGEIKNGQVVFKDTTLTKADENNIKQAFSKINKWQNTSVKGMDGLRQAVGNLMDDFKVTGNSRANVILSKVKDSITKDLSKNVPGYSDVLKTYGSKTELANNVLKELSLKGSAKESTQLNQVLRLFKKDPQVVKQLSSIMGEKEVNSFLNDISGAILSEWAPKGVLSNIARAVGDIGLAGGAIMTGSTPLGLASLGTVAASSPRIVGKVARLSGKAQASGVSSIAKKLTTLGAKKITGK